MYNLTLRSAELFKHGSLADAVGRNTMWLLLGNGCRLIFQAAYFVLLARCLGPDQYGIVVAITAAAAIVTPLIGNGYSSIMIKRVARDRSQFGAALGDLLMLTLLSGLLLAALLIPACHLFLPPAIGTRLIVLVLVSDLVIAPYTAVAGVAFWSVELMGWTAALNAFVTFTRVVGLSVLILIGRPTLMAWSVTYLIASAVTGTIAVVFMLRRMPRPSFHLRRAVRDLREGAYFSTSLAAQTIYNDIDKTMLARLSTLDAVGIYGAAYRIIEVAMAPVSSLLAAAYPGFFRYGQTGIAATAGHRRMIAARAVPYSLAAFAALMLGAPLVPWMLGPEYNHITEALRWLSLLPLLKTVHYCFADSLTGAGYQRQRVLVQLSVAIFNVLLNLWIIPVYGWRGAAWASLASDGLLAVSLWYVCRYLTHRQRRPSHDRSLSASAPVDAELTAASHAD